MYFACMCACERFLSDSPSFPVRAPSPFRFGPSQVFPWETQDEAGPGMQSCFFEARRQPLPSLFKVKSSRYSKYELYLLYLACMCVKSLFSVLVPFIFRFGFPLVFPDVVSGRFFRVFPEAVLKKRL